jgi:hypothetical protein
MDMILSMHTRYGAHNPFGYCRMSLSLTMSPDGGRAWRWCPLQTASTSACGPGAGVGYLADFHPFAENLGAVRRIKTCLARG